VVNTLLPRLAAAFAIPASPITCHPDRSGPIFSFAPSSGASGRVVEGSWHKHRVLAPACFSTFAFRVSFFERRLLIADNLLHYFLASLLLYFLSRDTHVLSHFSPKLKTYN